MTKGDKASILFLVGIVVAYFWLTWGVDDPPETQEEFDSAAIRSMECYLYSELGVVGAERNLVLGPDYYRELSDIFKFYYDKYANEAGWSKEKKSSAERAYKSVLVNELITSSGEVLSFHTLKHRGDMCYYHFLYLEDQ